MREIVSSAPVMVTGATGYVAGWIVRKLLNEGFTVHAPVRNPYKLEQLKHLKALADDSRGEIRFFKADLMEEGSYDAAMAECQLVFHTASPFTLAVEDPQRDLVDPAVNGTRNVLASANRTDTVERVVLTSSCAAIYGDNRDLESLPGKTLDEAVWNSSSSLSHQPYSFSKTVAERAAWEMAAKQERWDLVVINPSFVIGPAIDPQASSESFALITQLGDGTMKAGAPDYGTGVVDVRDLAEAHFNAGFTPSAAGRNIVSGHNSSLLEIASILQARFGERFPIPRRKMPKWLIWTVGPIVSKGAMSRKTISRNVGYPWKADNSKSVKELGMCYRPLAESAVDMFQQMIDCKRFG